MPTYAKPIGVTSPVFQGEGVEMAIAWNRIDFAAAELTLNAVFEAVRLPRGAIVHRVWGYVTDMDSGAAGLIGIGVAGDTARYVQGFSIQAAGKFEDGNSATSIGTMNTAAKTAFTVETPISVLISTAPGTAVAGSILVNVAYTCE